MRDGQYEARAAWRPLLNPRGVLDGVLSTTMKRNEAMAILARAPAFRG